MIVPVPLVVKLDVATTVIEAAVPVISPVEVTARTPGVGRLTAPPKVADPELEMVKLTRPVVSPAPTAARVTAPVPASRIRVSALPPVVPVIAPVTVMSPAPAPVETVGVFASPMIIAPLKFRSPWLVLRSPATVMLVLAVNVRAFSKTDVLLSVEMSLPDPDASKVIVPEMVLVLAAVTVLMLILPPVLSPMVRLLAVMFPNSASVICISPDAAPTPIVPPSETRIVISPDPVFKAPEVFRLMSFAVIVRELLLEFTVWPSATEKSPAPLLSLSESRTIAPPTVRLTFMVTPKLAFRVRALVNIEAVLEKFIEAPVLFAFKVVSPVILMVFAPVIPSTVISPFVASPIVKLVAVMFCNSVPLITMPTPEAPKAIAPPSETKRVTVPAPAFMEPEVRSISLAVISIFPPPVVKLPDAPKTRSPAPLAVLPSASMVRVPVPSKVIA